MLRDHKIILFEGFFKLCPWDTLSPPPPRDTYRAKRESVDDIVVTAGSSHVQTRSNLD